MPNLSRQWTTFIFFAVIFAGFLGPDLFPGHPVAYRWVQAIAGFLGLLNHSITAKSNPDGTPAPPAVAKEDLK